MKMGWSPLVYAHPGTIDTEKTRTIPVSFPGSYDTLLATARNCNVAPYCFIHLVCPKNQCPPGSLWLTPWMASRAPVLLDEDGEAYQKKEEEDGVPLAICKGCGHRPRVLPEELLPYKTYALAIVEKACAAYLNESTASLRSAVQRIKGHRPHYSTLHGWLGALGDKALDRVQPDKTPQPGALTTSAIIAETAIHHDSQLTQRWVTTQPDIADNKYRSQVRHDTLQACFRLLLMAASLFADAFPLTGWHWWLLQRHHVPGWWFLSRSVLTDLQLRKTKNVSLPWKVEIELIRNRSP